MGFLNGCSIYRYDNEAAKNVIKTIINAKEFDRSASAKYRRENAKIGLAVSKGKKNKLVIGTHNLGDILNGDNTKAVSLYFNIKIQF